jgi:hypothetical protein
LAVLTAFILQKNWKASLSLQVLMNGENQNMVDSNVKQFLILTRLPKSMKINYWERGFEMASQSGERGDLNISYLKDDAINFESIRNRSNLLGASFLFTMDSGIENALA